MKFSSVFALLLAAAFAQGYATMTGNPLAKVISLMDSLSAKLSKLGEEEDAAYVKYVEWCDDVSKNSNNEIKTMLDKESKLEAEIAKLTADIDNSDSVIEKLVASITKDSSDLKDAILVRDKEVSEFNAEEAELIDGIDTLGRAIAIVGRDMAKNPAAFAQLDTSNMKNALKALGTVLEAASFTAADKTKLTALVQSQQQTTADDEDFAPNAPAAAVYKTHSSGIMDVLEDMKEKAEEQLSTLRKEETSAKNNFEMLKQSLEDSIAADNKDMDDEKAARAEAEEAKGTAEGDLAQTVKDLKQTKDALENSNNMCMQTATDHEASVQGRTEELKVIAEARKLLTDSTSGASGETYTLFEVGKSRINTRADLANVEVVRMVQQLAKSHHSAALNQLASRISAVLRYGSADGDDVFAKIKGLIADMIAKLQKQAEEDQAEKAYCDDQMAKTEAKKVELDDDIAKLTSKIDQNSAASATLKAEVTTLQAELKTLFEEQSQMDKIRAKEHATFLEAKADLEAGLQGVGAALKTLREYYGGAAAGASMLQQPKMPEYHDKATGAGSSIIGMLEVVESDFAKELALEEKTESDAEAEYQAATQENSVIKTTKNQDVKYKTAEFIGRDKKIADLASDKDTASTALAAVMEYYARIKDRCIAKPESYEEIKARRTAEISGLKEALAILEGETAFAQGAKRGLRRHNFLGA